MNLSESTRRKLIGLLLQEVREKHEAVTAAKVTLASTSTSWECMAEFNGYVPPQGSPKKGPIGYDEAQHKKTVASNEKAVKHAEEELDRAYAELAEVMG